MSITEFVKEINALSPSVEKIVERFRKYDTSFSYDQALVYKKDNTLRLTDTIVFDDQIDCLIYGTNISSIGIGGINFRSKIKTIDNGLKQFASYNDFYRFCYSTNELTIISMADDLEGEELVSASFDQYLMLLCEYEKFYRKEVFDVEFSVDTSFSILSELIEKGVSKKWVTELIPTYSFQ